MVELVKLGEGREAEIFAWDESHVVRVMRDPSLKERVLTEAAALTAAKQAGCPVPEPGEVVEVDGRPGLVMQRARGNDLLTVLGARPWKVGTFGKLTARVHHSLLLVKAPEQTRRTKEYLRGRIQNSGLDPVRLAAALELLEVLPDGDRLCHGDFHPGNILMDRDEPLVIDWTNVSAGDPVNDIARTMMTLRMGVPPPGTPNLVLRLLKIGRALYLGSYRAQLKKLFPTDRKKLEDWTTVHLAARLAEGIEPEMELLDRALRERLFVAGGHHPTSA